MFTVKYRPHWQCCLCNDEWTRYFQNRKSWRVCECVSVYVAGCDLSQKGGRV